MSNRCLVCGKETDGSGAYHPRCSRSFFGRFPAPPLDLTLDEIGEYGARNVLARIVVTGVQKKLSLGIESSGKKARFTIVGLWGYFILKPPVKEYPELPQNEDLLMRLARLAGIPVVPHALIHLASEELAYISRRIDRTESGKIAMEDFCQISQRLTEDKYKGSLERVGKLLKTYSSYPGLDAIDFFERALFCFITGNADMHLKNFSLYETPGGMRLAPAYDLVSSALVLPDDTEETALTVNGKKSRLRRTDFEALATALAINEKARANVMKKFLGLREPMAAGIEQSWLSKEMRRRLGEIITQRMAALE